MPDHGELLVIGECVADIVQLPGEAPRVHPGGSPANVAYGLARLGHRTTLLTQLGPDGNGRLIREHLASAGVEVHTDGSATATPSALVTLDAAGRATYAFDVAWDLSPVAAAPAPAHVHTGSIGAVAEPGSTTVLGLVREARAAATVSYDPNVRPALMGDRARAVRRVEECVALSDLVKASDEDLEWLYPGERPDRVAERWLGLGPAAVLVTRGGEGALAVLPGDRIALRAPAVEVVDTVGAGDAFMSGALHALAAHGLIGRGARERLHAVARDAVADVLRHAVASATVTVSRAGANPPGAHELHEALTHN
ncbi:carbohydrate kinase [Streptomyces sp. NPDC018007]|uniref:carbohydrate kinase n=1 Tax=Streptomyces sp. NPDC018007 TaxID=3365029 RepID=UPI0037AE25EA